MKRTQEQKDLMRDATLSKLWLRHSFLGYFNSKINNKWVNESQVPAPAYTDDKNVVINWQELEKPQWEQMTSDNFVFLTAHELLHILDFTTARRGNRIPELWNISADYVINASLIHNSTANGTPNPIGEMPHHDSKITDENPKGYIGLYDPRFLGKTIEQVYDMLYQENKDDIEKALEQQKEMEKALQKVLDKIMKGQQVIDINDGIDPNLDPEQVEQIRQEIKAKVNNILNEMGTTAGKLDSALARACQTLLTPPKFDWKGFLSNYLKSFIKGDSTWKKLSRRTWGVGNLMAGIKTESDIKLGIAIDTSGSVSDKQVKEMLSHIQKIMKSFKSFEIDLWCFSTKVHIDTLKTFNKGNITDLINYKLKSFGGTDIKSNFDYLTQNKKSYNVFICMTDGYDDIENISFSKCPVIWAITQNNDFTSPKNIRNSKVMWLDK